MAEKLPPEALEFLELFLTALGSLLVSGAGLFIESRAVATAAGGDLALGGYLLAVGAVVLYFGVYLLGYDRLLPQLREFTDR